MVGAAAEAWDSEEVVGAWEDSWWDLGAAWWEPASPPG